jgi:hypothetical protein
LGSKCREALIFPNPANGKIRVKLPVNFDLGQPDIFQGVDLQDNYTFSISDSRGLVVKAARLYEDFEVDLTDLSPGVYRFTLYDKVSKSTNVALIVQ